MPDPLLSLPLAQIDAEALPRDRSTSDPAAFEELWHSILRTGLRQPVEVFADANPAAAAPYALISGHRRLAAFHHLHATMGLPAFSHVPAFLRSPESIPAALAAMIEENEVRADLSPWEKGRILVETTTRGHFATIDAAILALHPHTTPVKRTRLRMVAAVAEAFPDDFTAPEAFSQNQLLRLAAALRADFAPLIRHALTEHRPKSPEAEWSLLAPILDEADTSLRDPEPVTRPGRPRRFVKPRPDLSVRRIKTADGWTLCFTGAEATGMLMENLMDEVERWVGLG